MDQEKAQVLFREGATLIVLNVPQGTNFGIDYNSWTTGPKFKGIKMIPPGVHFVYYSSVNSDNQQAPRTGFFYNFKSREILVKKWNAHAEELTDSGINPHEDADKTKMDMDKFLGAYPYERYKKWVSLTNHIRPELASRLSPVNGKVSSVTEFQSEPSTSQSRKKAQEDAMTTDGDQRRADGLPHMNTVEGTELRLTPITRRMHPAGATPQEITRHQLDSSYALQTVVDNHHQGCKTDVLGELQFAFISFLIGQNYDAFEQWKQFVRMLCTADSALSDPAYLDLFTQFIGMMHYQVKEIPEDFFVDIVSQNNFLTSTLSELFSNLESSTAEPSLRQRGHKFKVSLQKRFKWDFSTEPDDCAPVIVE